ncbi:MAG: UDP-4-amino-4,6-dideoxy-N-acetyl-beta-L-altrosamine transaminase [Alteromonadaceae bacterium]|nr:UDP-4-amino-4,6-dideoxy-N-acetyl-beta-L-altrosamine transaminase [Alteromonadaceae bacterium]
MIPYGKQDINQADIDAVIEVLHSDWLTQGSTVPKFEQAIADKCQVKLAVAVSSATAALHIACLALDIKEKDRVWTSPITFVASANCALYCGATVDFIDIDLNSGNISVMTLEKKLVKAKQQNKLPKVIIVVHLAGQSCDMLAIYNLSQQYGFKIIEDASHAIGGQYKNKPVGCCQFSDITVFSFHPVKIITSAEGGMAVTNTQQLAEKMQLYRSHGITANEQQMTEPSHGPWYYQQIALGFNYRMTDIQAALGLSQLYRIDSFIEQRNQLAKKYDKAFKETAITPLIADKNCLSAYHLYLILLPQANAEQHKKAIITLREQNIFAHVHYIPVHLQPFYQNLGFKLGDFPNAEQYYQQAITLPLHPKITRLEQNYIIEKVKALL